MKRNLFQRLSVCCVRRAALSALLAGGLLAACSDDPADGGQGRPFAAGEHPVVLTAAVEQATRATADDTWSGGEQVAVEAAPNTAGAQAEVKTYTADGDGRLTSDTPFWWTNSAEKKTLRAWYCGDGSTAAGGVNASAVPNAWSVEADQSGEGYRQSDLLFAPATAAAFAGDAAVPLRFYHQTAKVVVNIRKAETVTDAAQIKAVRIGDGNLVLAVGFAAPADGATAGTWATAGAPADGTVTPRKLAAPTKPEYVASYEALVVPQPTAGRRMVAVETDFGTMYYTAPGNAKQLEAGKVRTYNITVYADRLEVSVANGGDGAWTDGGSEEVTSWPRTYAAEDLKIGDYFYSDGTWSDGGLREHRADGTQVWADSKPAPETGGGKTVVGIVFQTDPSRIGEAEKQELESKGLRPSGLVMSVRAEIGKMWAINPFLKTNEVLPELELTGDAYRDISGLYNTQLMRNDPDYQDENHPVFAAVAEFSKTNPAPETTTGWFVPSAGQTWDLIAHLTRAPVLSYQGLSNALSDTLYPPTMWKQQSALNARLQYVLEGIPTADPFDAYNNSFWTSSQCKRSLAVVWFTSNANAAVSCGAQNKNSTNINLRFVLAFGTKN